MILMYPNAILYIWEQFWMKNDHFHQRIDMAKITYFCQILL